MGYRKVSTIEQCYYIIKGAVGGKVRNLRLRLKLWLKPKSDCSSCCLWCKYFEQCRSELEADNEN